MLLVLHKRVYSLHFNTKPTNFVIFFALVFAGFAHIKLGLFDFEEAE